MGLSLPLKGRRQDSERPEEDILPIKMEGSINIFD